MRSSFLRLWVLGGLSEREDVNGSFRLRTAYGGRRLGKALVTKENSGFAAVGSQRCAPRGWLFRPCDIYGTNSDHFQCFVFPDAEAAP